MSDELASAIRALAEAVREGSQRLAEAIDLHGQAVAAAALDRYQQDEAEPREEEPAQLFRTLDDR